MRHSTWTETGWRRAVVWTLAAVTAAAWLPAALPASAAQPGELLAEVKSRGVLRVANTQANPPWNFRNEKNELVGFDVDVARELARRMGIPKVEFI